MNVLCSDFAREKLLPHVENGDICEGHVNREIIKKLAQDYGLTYAYKYCKGNIFEVETLDGFFRGNFKGFIDTASGCFSRNAYNDDDVLDEVLKVLKLMLEEDGYDIIIENVSEAT